MGHGHLSVLYAPSRSWICIPCSSVCHHFHIVLCRALCIPWIILIDHVLSTDSRLPLFRRSVSLLRALYSVFEHSLVRVPACNVQRMLMYALKNRFCDKTGRSGSTLQIVNGIILLLVFFSVRIVYGTYISGVFLKEVYSRWSEIPYHVSIIYGFANVSLNSLNAFWFYKMVKSVANRVRGGVVSDDRGGHVQLPAQKTETKKTT